MTRFLSRDRVFILAFLLPLVVVAFALISQVVKTQIIGRYEVASETMAAAAVQTMLPPLLIALFFQRYLVPCAWADAGSGEALGG